MGTHPESGASAQGGGSSAVGNGVEYITAIAAEASGSQGASAAQLFSTPTPERRAVTITNCDAALVLYVGHSSSVSASLYRAKLAAATSITIPAGAAVPIYIFGEAGTTDYYACEEIRVTE